MGVPIPIAELEAYINQQFPASVGHIPLRESCNAAANKLKALQDELTETNRMLKEAVHCVSGMEDEEERLEKEVAALRIQLGNTRPIIATTA